MNVINKLLKTIFTLSIVFIMIGAFCQKKSYAEKFNPGDYEPDSTTIATGATLLKDKGNKIVGIIRTAGSIISVVVLIMLGIKYMLGTVEERAEYKKSMLPYFIGSAFVFGITTILGIIIEIAGVI